MSTPRDVSWWLVEFHCLDRRRRSEVFGLQREWSHMRPELIDTDQSVGLRLRVQERSEAAALGYVRTRIDELQRQGRLQDLRYSVKVVSNP